MQASVWSLWILIANSGKQSGKSAVLWLQSILYMWAGGALWLTFIASRVGSKTSRKVWWWGPFGNFPLFLHRCLIPSKACCCFVIHIPVPAFGNSLKLCVCWSELWMRCVFAIIASPAQQQRFWFPELLPCDQGNLSAVIVCLSLTLESDVQIVLQMKKFPLMLENSFSNQEWRRN